MSFKWKKNTTKKLNQYKLFIAKNFHTYTPNVGNITSSILKSLNLKNNLLQFKKKFIAISKNWTKSIKAFLKSLKKNFW